MEDSYLLALRERGSNAEAPPEFSNGLSTVLNTHECPSDRLSFLASLLHSLTSASWSHLAYIPLAPESLSPGLLLQASDWRQVEGLRGLNKTVA